LVSAEPKVVAQLMVWLIVKPEITPVEKLPDQQAMEVVVEAVPAPSVQSGAAVAALAATNIRIPTDRPIDCTEPSELLIRQFRTKG